MIQAFKVGIIKSQYKQTDTPPNGPITIGELERTGETDTSFSPKIIPKN